MKLLYQELHEEYSIRIEDFQKISKEIQSEILKARDNIMKIQDIMLDTIEKR